MPIYAEIEEEIRIVAGKAKERGMWFRHSYNHTWLTPEEFEEEALSHIIKYGRNDRTMLIYFLPTDPKNGIQTKLIQLNSAAVELEQFTSRVLNYYNPAAMFKEKKASR